MLRLGVWCHIQGHVHLHVRIHFCAVLMIHEFVIYCFVTGHVFAGSGMRGMNVQTMRMRQCARDQLPQQQDGQQNS